MTTHPVSPPAAPHAPSRSGLAVGAPPGGAILRLKTGYNPNSSSIGSIVFGMPAALAVATVAFGTAAGILGAALLRARAGAPTPEANAPAAADEGNRVGEASTSVRQSEDS